LGLLISFGGLTFSPILQAQTASPSAGANEAKQEKWNNAPPLK